MESTTSEHLPLDHRAIDWPRVARAVYQVRQHYRYTYTGPVWDLKQRLVMVPPNLHSDQRLVSYQFEVRGTSGECAVTWEEDAFENRVGRVRAERVPRAVDFEATYRVERMAARRRFARPSPLPDGWEPEIYRQHTALTAPDVRLEAVAGGLAASESSPHRLAELAHDWAASALTYQFGITGVQTPAAMALHFGRGVCQDYAHIMLTVLRLLGIACRYVSGHLLGEGAPHAWVEVLLEDPAEPDSVEVIAYDPTHHRRVGLNYITVAVGRDYADISPTSGYFSGPEAGKLSASKHAEIVDLDYRADQHEPEAAA